MNFSFGILEKTDILKVVPLVEKLNDFKISKPTLEARFLEMATQNYECAVIYHDDIIIGVCGLWFCTRHYAGKSVEVDHVYIDENYRGKGVGKQFFKWIYNYVIKKGCEAVELNTYVSNHASHKFYYNEDFKILGYHFLKKF
ncbi:GNAT family N-acetyltransferase [Hyunsoonleella pacifica]|uniref:GNAT family N-acetyltransferase n=1 Tax=Hyunsoonleella pacifica TaxID=1080224 RepID=A0A4Q9FQJ2_9FLAO|nr:GNAT family N-acetyltransferase [Hyunsoonleella pacifica]TBN15496.1 GNAT family N-acetyltransferase [Hyunsoonleella pacifica]GGD24572.1 N-acetyltransferase [Hyunsoonleella pacifica]